MRVGWEGVVPKVIELAERETDNTDIQAYFPVNVNPKEMSDGVLTKSCYILIVNEWICQLLIDARNVLGVMLLYQLMPDNKTCVNHNGILCLVLS